MSSKTKSILKIDNLSKFYRSYWTFKPLLAVKSISLEVFANEAYGFLGHNGAGKTTTIKCIVGIARRNGGEIYLNGEPLESSKQHSLLGYLPEHPYFYEHLSVKETLEFFSALHNISGSDRDKRVDEVLELVGLETRRKSPVKTLSKGLQQRLGMAQSIVNKPKLLILDEPFSGLDPVGRKEIRELILKLKEQGTTIFMSSHILSDVEDICDRVCIVAHGEIKTTFHIAEVPERFGEQLELKVGGLDSKESLKGELDSLAISSSMEPTSSGKIFNYEFKDYATAKKAMQKALENDGIVKSFSSGAASLEEIFMEVTSEGYSRHE